jgi:hypothetical protein
MLLVHQIRTDKLLIVLAASNKAVIDWARLPPAFALRIVKFATLVAIAKSAQALLH